MRAGACLTLTRRLAIRPLHVPSSAINRVRSIQQQAAKQQPPLRWPDDALLVAVEGGVLQRGPADLYCFAWAAVTQAAAGARTSTCTMHQLLRACVSDGSPQQRHSTRHVPCLRPCRPCPQRASQAASAPRARPSFCCRRSCHAWCWAAWSWVGAQQADLCMLRAREHPSVDCMHARRDRMYLQHQPLTALLCCCRVLAGAADDAVFGRYESGRGTGTIGHLTRDFVTRAAYYESCLIMALVPLMHPSLYPGFHIECR